MKLENWVSKKTKYLKNCCSNLKIKYINSEDLFFTYRSALRVASYVKSTDLVIGPGTIHYNALKSTQKAPGTKPGILINLGFVSETKPNQDDLFFKDGTLNVYRILIN